MVSAFDIKFGFAGFVISMVSEFSERTENRRASAERELR